MDLVKDLLKTHNSIFHRTSSTLRTSDPFQLTGRLAPVGRPVFLHRTKFTDVRPSPDVRSTHVCSAPDVRHLLNRTVFTDIRSSMDVWSPDDRIGPDVH